MGPPCVPEATWHACEPAMTVVPNFLVSGILAMALGLFTVVSLLSGYGHDVQEHGRAEA